MTIPTIFHINTSPIKFYHNYEWMSFSFMCVIKLFLRFESPLSPDQIKKNQLTFPHKANSEWIITSDTQKNSIPIKDEKAKKLSAGKKVLNFGIIAD